MKVIHKQAFKIDQIKSPFALATPHGSRILKVANQHESLAVWYLCDPNTRGTTIYSLYVFKTGHKVDLNAHTYIDTVSFRNGNFILHVFEGVNADLCEPAKEKSLIKESV